MRQLQNFIERLVVLSDGNRLTVADVERELARQQIGGLSKTGPRGTERGGVAQQGAEREGDEREENDRSSGGTLEASRREAEREAIVTSLERAGNNRSVASRLLGISRRTLYHKLAEHGLI